MFYFLAERHSATKYHQLYPELAITLTVQYAIVEDLRKIDVQYIVLSSQFESWTEPNQSALSRGIVDLDSFIGNNYQPVERFGESSFWKLTQGT